MIARAVLGSTSIFVATLSLDQDLKNTFETFVLVILYKKVKLTGCPDQIRPIF
jgi:hypothetical protein